MALPAVLAACGLSRSFPGRPPVEALADVDLDVARGEFVVIAGPSGSGKTTLLQLAAGIDTPDAGQVVLAGRLLSGRPARERAARRLAEVGLVFAEGNLSPALSLADNAELPLAALGLPRAERRARVAELFDLLGITALSGRLPDRTSAGERQRAALARALATRPLLLVADEPTAHLDGPRTDGFIDLLREAAHARGLAVLLATHDPRVLARADRTVTLADGRREAVA